MSEAVERARTAPAVRLTEDWCSIGIGVGLILIAAALFSAGGSIKWLAVAPQKWSHLPDLATQLGQNGLRYGALFLLWATVFGIGLAALGIRLWSFLPAFVVVYGISAALYFLGLWDQSAHYNLEPPLVALGLGLLISNTVGTPEGLLPALRVEFYIKTGIVLLGAGLPLTLIAWAGPVAIVQAAIVSHRSTDRMDRAARARKSPLKTGARGGGRTDYTV